MMAAFGDKREGEVDIEVFSCAGGMAEGFRRAGIEFDMAVDMAKDHVDSYERNLGHRPVQMDARDLLRMLQLGARIPVRLGIFDPPCTPRSRAGKRQGQADDRDMLAVTAEIISLLRPRAYLIGNVPGLEDSGNLRIVQEVIGGLARFGYCVRDFVNLDAADFGVPQHRVRPFWYGHLHGPCVRWEPPTHGDPKEIGEHLPGIDPLLPWVTCGQALGHLSKKDLGRMVTLRKRSQNGKQHTSLMDQPARVVGTSNLSDGNVVTPQSQRVVSTDRPATTVQCREDRQGSGMMIDWMNERPATTVMRDPRLAAPGHKDKDWKKQGERSRSSQKAVLLSPKAAAILQGFPESWVFCGKTKKAVWSQIGQAMPPALAAAVGRAVLRQFAETVDDGKPESYVPYTPAPVQPPAASAPEQVSVGLDLTVQPLPPDEIAARRAELQRQGFAIPEVA